MDFVEKLTGASRKNKSLLCVGLDPDLTRIPRGISVSEFNREIISATSDLVCAYKLNLAFYEALGEEGYAALKDAIAQVPDEVVVIGDAKRGDIGNTARAYAKALFEVFNFDATTVSPYLGFDSIKPFIDYKDRGVFILCRTSNESARDFQSLKCEGAEGRRLFEIVAAKASQWNTYGNIGLVVGATYPEELKLIRDACPEMPLLIPGVGAQGGDLAKAVQYGVDGQGGGAVINSSRQIIYASENDDFAAAARRTADKLRVEINANLP